MSEEIKTPTLQNQTIQRNNSGDVEDSLERKEEKNESESLSF
jgi:hypothetical protein